MKNGYDKLKKSFEKTIDHFWHSKHLKHGSHAIVLNLRTMEQTALLTQDEHNQSSAPTEKQKDFFPNATAEIQALLDRYKWAYSVKDERPNENEKLFRLGATGIEPTEVFKHVLDNTNSDPIRIMVKLDKTNGVWILFDNEADATLAVASLQFESMI